MLLCHLLVLMSCLVANVATYNTNDVKTLHKQLFTTNEYNKYVRPSLDFDQPTFIYIDLYLNRLNEVDVVKEEMSTTCAVLLEWIDPSLAWEPNLYNDITYMYTSQIEIWRPDITVLNGIKKAQELGNAFFLTHINYEGYIQWAPFEVFDTKCKMDVLYFPFDKQVCSIQLGLWASTIYDVYPVLGNKGMEMTSYMRNDGWDVISTSSNASLQVDNTVIVMFSIEVKRRPQHYLLNIVAPVILLSILVNFTFAIPVESGEKMGYTMTVFLAFAVFLTIVSASLPVTSQPSIIGIHLVSMLVIGALVVIITAVELRIHFLDASRPIPKYICSIVKYTKRLQCKKCRKMASDNVIYVEDNVHQEENKNKALQQPTDKSDCKSGVWVEPETETDSDCENEAIRWSDVTSAIDFYCFYACLFVIVIITSFLYVFAFLKSR